ncbi:Uncharacterized protein BM_BM14307 [Brugia malayi]|uniref:Bm14307 n=1 Tax=Brugia malayi TaxID=6279 RepID=A0A0J9Y3G7_BRUMA|nr:Uncharacterized protein BM_BM14307 [Brugia malayi]CDQ01151.1 Bm14307 [Brugia malayi]VIO94638.1 Uncharacterized protein BM_BM14307 [Brugia malayi]
MRLSLLYPMLVLLLIITITQSFVLQELPLNQYSLKRYNRNFDPIEDFENYIPNYKPSMLDYRRFREVSLI